MNFVRGRPRQAMFCCCLFFCAISRLPPNPPINLLAAEPRESASASPAVLTRKAASRRYGRANVACGDERAAVALMDPRQEMLPHTPGVRSAALSTVAAAARRQARGFFAYAAIDKFGLASRLFATPSSTSSSYVDFDSNVSSLDSRC
jgi:hypothetical protein